MTTHFDALYHVALPVNCESETLPYAWKPDHIVKRIRRQ